MVKKISREMLDAMSDSLWREAYKALETRNVDLIYNAGINLMQIEACKRLYGDKLDEK